MLFLYKKKEGAVPYEFSDNVFAMASALFLINNLQNHLFFKLQCLSFYFTDIDYSLWHSLQHVYKNWSN